MSDVPPPASNQPIADSYDASKLGKLEGLEAVRKKPGMYIGGTDERALHHCVSEVLDNSVDEHLAGHCKRIDVTIHVDGSISIRDNGRGIPVDIHPQYKIPGVEMVLTTLHSGGKYGQGGYKFSGGTHGVGAKCVNAVSEWFEVEVSRGGQVHHMKFERGKTVKKLEVIGKAKGTGTLITFKPDPEIFKETTVFVADRIAQRLRDDARIHIGATARGRRHDQSDRLGWPSVLRNHGKSRECKHEGGEQSAHGRTFLSTKEGMFRLRRAGCRL